MRFFIPMFAQDETGPTMLSQDAHTRLVLFLVYGAVIALLIAWVIFIRKQKAKRKRVYKNQPHTWQRNPEEDKERRRKRRHERQRRSAHPERPLNPTLSESGGLPPRRPDDVPPPGA